MDEPQARTKISRRNINDLIYVDTTLMAESEEEQKSLLMRVKEKSDKACFKLNMQKTKIMSSGPIISWKIEGEKLYAMKDVIFLDSKITMDSDCSHEIKICLFLGRKAMANLDNLLRSRDISLPRNVGNHRYADTTLMAESEEELKSLLIRVKKKSEKVDLKFSIQKLRSCHHVPLLHGKWMGKK